jgi:sec-independent protein translocase protein TatA
MLAMLGWPELAVIAVIAVLIFGRRLPEVGRDIGKGLNEFKRGLKEIGADVDDVKNEVRDVQNQARRSGDD